VRRSGLEVALLTGIGLLALRWIREGEMRSEAVISLGCAEQPPISICYRLMLR
jgi:hypothetical protein